MMDTHDWRRMLAQWHRWHSRAAPADDPGRVEPVRARVLRQAGLPPDYDWLDYYSPEESERRIASAHSASPAMSPNSSPSSSILP